MRTRDTEQAEAADRQDVGRAVTALALAAVVAAPALLLTTDVTLARIAVNHNETPGRDQR